MILETERLVLRPIEPVDGAALYPIMSNPVVMAHWDYTEVEDLAAVEEMIRLEIEEMTAGLAYYWAIEHGLDHAFLGVADLSGVERRHRRAEVGFLLAEAAWGQGFGHEAMRAVIDHAASLGIKRLSARAHAGNDRSERLLERLGFRREGFLRGHVQRAGERRDCKVFGLLL